MFDLAAATGSALVMVTHDEGLAARADRMVRLADGRVVA
jgi:putative ABC transport system ATP-binding protein